MIPRLSFLISLLISSAITALATSEEIVQRHLDASPGGKLIVDVDFGTVEVSGGPGDKTVAVNIRRTVEISDKAKEKEFVAAAPITVSQENNVITVRARSNRHWEWNDRHTRMEARYSIQVPRSFNADLHTGGGAIQVSDVSGKVEANTGGGKLKFSRVDGSTDAKTSGGAVSLTDCDGAIQIQSSGGRIVANGGKGSLDAQTSGGQISVRNFAGQVDLVSNGGQLILNEITGPISARTGGGQINATVSAATDIKLETGAGAITVGIPANGGFNVDARSEIGGVTTDLPVNEGRHDRDTLTGSINGGGKALFLRTSAGSINIKAAATERASR
ncbi:MAG TPA: DUF4097 family beta strand repeat-containing protein [Chthoniobacterales bacterium]|nr:DUF4097 family beta strand repeat-containing protein [Chthoniobacterales bacterium]